MSLSLPARPARRLFNSLSPPVRNQQERASERLAQEVEFPVLPSVGFRRSQPVRAGGGVHRNDLRRGVSQNRQGLLLLGGGGVVFAVCVCVCVCVKKALGDQLPFFSSSFQKWRAGAGSG